MYKRLFDLLFAFLISILCAPFIIVLAIFIRYFMGSPIVFKQQRTGLKATPFYIYKFRSMNNKKDQFGMLLPDDKRLNSFGRFLRSTSLDELPSLWNVIKGEMSIVGPRPLLIEYVPLYDARQALRHNVKPGVTGWAQINGRNAITWQEKFNLDVWYVDHQSFWLDARIIFLTIKKVLFRDGISAKDEATMPKFTGNKNQ